MVLNREENAARRLITPDGKKMAKPWWSEARAPRSRLPAEVGGLLIRQIVHDKKHTEGLTAQLNALILIKLLDPKQAQRLQAMFVRGPEYAHLWGHPDGSMKVKHFSWMGTAHGTAYLITQATNKQVGLSEKPEYELPQLLRQGYVALLEGHDRIRTAFMPAEADHAYVHDPVSGALRPNRNPRTMHVPDTVTIY